MTLNACTIVSKNYLSFARVLANSFLEWQPGGRFFVLLVDRVEGTFDPSREPFELVLVDDLSSISELPSFLFKYSTLESNTAVKPYFLEHLFEHHELSNLVYFDPDILITGSLDELAGLVQRHAIVLTPHLTEPIDDGAHPDEQTIMKAGAYNLGFLALRRSAVVDRLLAWWKPRLYEHCVVRVEDGLFVDQKWMDLAPGLFGDVAVLTDPGYNVAYWNLHGRRVTLGPEGPQANGRPLVFFHFSGIEPERLGHVSKHQDRFRLGDLGQAAELYHRYAALLFEAGFREASGWPYAFGAFDDGSVIPDAARHLYLGLTPAQRRRFGDPFADSGGGSFRHWLDRPPSGSAERPYLSRLLQRVLLERPDLAAAYPDAAGRDLPGFAAWLAESAAIELHLDRSFLACLDEPSGRWSVGRLRRRLSRKVREAWRSPPAKALKGRIKLALGPRRVAAVKSRLGRGSALPVAARSAIGAKVRSAVGVGVNLVGYLQAETGMGQAARALAASLEAAGVPLSLHSLDLNVLAPNRDATYGARTSDFPHGVNLVVANADQLPLVRSHLGELVFRGRRTIGYWLWELDQFPSVYHGAFEDLAEVWTPSSFCLDAFSAVAPCPVRRLPLPVAASAAVRDRGRFGLPEDAFVFLFNFNFLSYFERKNPLAVVAAFRRAFPRPAGEVLVLKASQSDFAPEALARLEKAIGDAPIRLLDGCLEHSELANLLASCDAYVSLHRSEGYGLTLAEAMALEKPVIATAYSGNVDFFDLNNGFPVRYRLVQLDRDEGPYPAGAHWAEPDVEHAAELMRRVRAGGQEVARRVERAQRDIAERLAPAVVGKRMRGLLGH